MDPNEVIDVPTPPAKSSNVFKNISEKILAIRIDHLGIVALIILLGIIIFKPNFSKKEPVVTYNYINATALEVKEVSLISTSKIKITFNNDVDHHLLEEHLVVTPSTNGRLVEVNGKEFVFENGENFPLSTTLVITFREGLVGKNKLPLLSTQSFNLQTAIESNQVTFEKDGIFARVLSGAPGIPIPINIKSGNGIGKPTVTIYKSTQADLLNYLLYWLPDGEKQEDNYTYNLKFRLNYRPHDKSQIFEKFNVTESEQKSELNLPSGIYYLEATEGELPVGSTYIIVSSKGIVLREDDKKVILSAFDTKSGKRINDSVDVGFYNLKDLPTLLSRHAFSGTTSIDTPYDTKLDVIIATIGDETALVPVKIKDSLADIRVNRDLNQDTQVFVYTDRPIYKPGDTVFYRGTVRIDNDALYQVPPAGSKVIVTKAYGAGEEEVTLDKNGNFYGNFVLSKEAKDDEYAYLTARAVVPNDKETWNNSASASYVVKKYKKPAYELSLTKNKDEYFRNEKMDLNFSGTFFNTKPLANEKVELTVYSTNFYEQEKKVYNENFNITQVGGMCGGGGTFDYYGEELVKRAVTLDSKGKSSLSLNLKDLNMPKTSQTVTVIMRKTDENGNILESATKAVVRANAFSVFYIPSPTTYIVGEEIIAPFYVDNGLSSEKLPEELSYDVKVYEDGKSDYQKKSDLSGKVKIDENGKGVIRLVAPDTKNNFIYLSLSVKDSSGNVTETDKGISIYRQREDKPVYWSNENNVSQTYLRIAADSNSYKVGETMHLTIVSPKDIDVLMSPERGRSYKAKVISLSKGENKLDVPVDEEYSPSVALTFNFFADGKYYSEGISLNVPAMHKLLNVKIEKDKESYSPNSTANLTVTLTDAKGNPVVGNFSLGLVDEAIYGLRKDATPLIHSSFYYFRGRTTNASSSLTMIGSYNGGGGRGGGGGGDNNGSPIDTVFWAPNLTTDPNGKLLVPVKLGAAKTVWRAQVIAVDNETDLGQNNIRIQVK